MVRRENKNRSDFEELERLWQKFINAEKSYARHKSGMLEETQKQFH